MGHSIVIYRVHRWTLQLSHRSNHTHTHTTRRTHTHAHTPCDVSNKVLIFLLTHIHSYPRPHSTHRIWIEHTFKLLIFQQMILPTLFFRISWQSCCDLGTLNSTLTLCPLAPYDPLPCVLEKPRPPGIIYFLASAYVPRTRVIWSRLRSLPLKVHTQGAICFLEFILLGFQPPSRLFWK